MAALWKLLHFVSDKQYVRHLRKQNIKKMSQPVLFLHTFYIIAKCYGKDLVYIQWTRVCKTLRLICLCIEQNVWFFRICIWRKNHSRIFSGVYAEWAVGPGCRVLRPWWAGLAIWLSGGQLELRQHRTLSHYLAFTHPEQWLFKSPRILNIPEYPYYKWPLWA